eukprot:gene10239-7282_t
MSCDGEAKQIEIFQEADIIQLFKDASIDFAKTPASCSAICQASDASQFFKAAKKRLAHAVVMADPLQHDGNNRAVRQLKELIGDRFASGKKSLVIKSLLKVVEAVRETLTLKIVRAGYETTGQWPISFVAAMSHCPTVKTMSVHEYNNMKDNVENLANVFRERGVLTEADMDEFNIIDMSEDTRRTPKDERVLHQQRAVLMNSAECTRQYKEYQMRLQGKKTASGRGPRAKG